MDRCVHYKCVYFIVLFCFICIVYDVLYLFCRSLDLMRLQYSFGTFIKRIVIIIIQSMFIAFTFVQIMYTLRFVLFCFACARREHKNSDFNATHSNTCTRCGLHGALFPWYHFITSLNWKGKISLPIYLHSANWKRKTNANHIHT